ncbi:MAG: creatininase family protein [Bradymonadia bacterium]
MTIWPEHLDHFSTTALATFLEQADRPVVLWPVGSVEPHGPHLPLGTDTLISKHNAEEALRKLRAEGVQAVIAPALPYGVTDFAAGFAGAVSVPAPILVGLITACVTAWLSEGFAHVSLINHHLEPGQLKALATARREIASAHGKHTISAPAVTSSRWGRRLTPEFKSGACHAGCYETSLILATSPALVDMDAATALPSIPVSLSEAIKAGQQTFVEAGMSEAYTGAPGAATEDEGHATYSLHGDMVATEVLEALEARLS